MLDVESTTARQKPRIRAVLRLRAGRLTLVDEQELARRRDRRAPRTN